MAEYLIEKDEWPWDYQNDCLDQQIVHLAIETGYLDMVRLVLGVVLDRGPKDASEKYGKVYRQFVIRAAKIGHVEITGILINSVRAADFGGKWGFKEKVEELKHMGFISAVRFGQTELVRFLLKEGAEVNRLYEIRYCALSIAQNKGFINIKKLLLENRALIVVKDKEV